MVARLFRKDYSSREGSGDLPEYNRETRTFDRDHVLLVLYRGDVSGCDMEGTGFIHRVNYFTRDRGAINVNIEGWKEDRDLSCRRRVLRIEPCDLNDAAIRGRHYKIISGRGPAV